MATSLTVQKPETGNKRVKSSTAIKDLALDLRRSLEGSNEPVKGAKLFSLGSALLQEEKAVRDTSAMFEFSSEETHAARVARTAELFPEEDLQMLALLVSSGMAVSEIAKRTRFREPEISLVCCSERFELVLRDVQQGAGFDPYKGFLASQKLPSLRALTLVRDNPNAADKDRLAAAKALLELGASIDPRDLEQNPTIDVVLEEERELETLLSDPTLKCLIQGLKLT